MIYNHHNKTIFGKKRIEWASMLFSGFLLFICVGTLVTFIVLAAQAKEKRRLSSRKYNTRFIPLLTTDPIDEEFQETTTLREIPVQPDVLNLFTTNQSKIQVENIGLFNISDNNNGILLIPSWESNNELIVNTQIINLDNLNNSNSWKENKTIQINIFAVKLNSSSDINIFMNITKT
ncbi:hypothetical protein GWI33_019626 [Rhynchophorus ferrugineus]|uniref:Uncharacterized protein n=1 Tax=Rhynchophorus ferrugineus TaxID=354439 RepID=A0A834M185_RHYFE|nr:hypothetical protein GWI33_019626 [Rhynchophorus ferrugineus]